MKPSAAAPPAQRRGAGLCAAWSARARRTVVLRARSLSRPRVKPRGARYVLVEWLGGASNVFALSVELSHVTLLWLSKF